MTISTSQKLTFDQFLKQCPDDGRFYELLNGEVVEIRATRDRDDVADFIADSLKDEIERLNHFFFIR